MSSEETPVRALTGGLVVEAAGERPAVRAMLAEALPAPESVATRDPRQTDVRVLVQATSAPFDVTGWEPITRGAVAGDGCAVLEDACGSGFDLLVRPEDDRLAVIARWRPSPAARILHRALGSRAVLLARAVLVQYPVLWWAGVAGQAPLHASVVDAAGTVALLAGPGGVGKSTLLHTELAAGGAAACDNLCVSDGRRVAGLLEPLRVAGGTGRRMPHGRRERPWPGSRADLQPDRVIVVRRDTVEPPGIDPLDAASASRVLVAGTYAAGELRRYWAFAATLALATGLGPAHPPVQPVARALADRLPCHSLRLPPTPGARLAHLLAPETFDDRVA